ncbi:MAG: DOMON-like domain-containing protein [Burkholderiales bacterium]
MRTDKLWLHTCFEVFIKSPGEENYYEFNFSPSTRWAMYRFDRYREGMPPENFDQPPRIALSQSERVLALECSAGLAQCRDLARAAEYQLAVCAVIEDHDGYLSYWALAHPPGKPDFHHRDGFVLHLEGNAE